MGGVKVMKKMLFTIREDLLITSHRNSKLLK